MKKALVMAGGGTRGIYQAGAVEALRELGEDDWNIITGTSVGALNAVMLVQHDFQAMIDMYEHLTADQIISGFVPNPDDMNLSTLIRERETIIPAFRTWLKDHGVDIAPFRELVHEYYHPDRFFASDIDFGCITATAKGHEPVYVTKDMMKENGEQWLVATAAAYPAFPMAVIDGTEYVDGGYFDNFPVDFAMRMGAEEIIAIDLSQNPKHPNYLDRDGIVYIHPHTELFSFLDFDKDRMRTARTMGYNDCMKAYGRYKGERYTFYPFEKPAYYNEWYRSVMLLETRIKLANSISDALRSPQYITDTLKEQLFVTHLTSFQYLFGMMDVLLDMCRADETKIMTYKEARNLLLASFKEAAEEDFSPFRQMGFNVADRKSVIARLLHHNLYPEHSFFTENVILTVYPFEQALADLLTYMMKELAEE